MICSPLDLKLQMCLIQLFPDLKKVVFLDDDIVVQHDMSSLWNMDLGGNVVGAVLDSSCGDGCCPGRTYSHYLNFSHPLISSNFNPDRCAWLHGMNIFDLEAWRKMNITSKYHQWLKHVSSHSCNAKWNRIIIAHPWQTLLLFYRISTLDWHCGFQGNWLHPWWLLRIICIPLIHHGM